MFKIYFWFNKQAYVRGFFCVDLKVGYTVEKQLFKNLHSNKTIDINLNSVFWSCRAFGKIMINQGSGSIINIGSMSGMIVNYGLSQSEYNTSKAGVHMLTKSLAVEWAKRGVRVNAVAPGYIKTEMSKPAYENPEQFKVMTEMTPQNRMGETHEIASTVLFLGSDASSFMNGSILVADGGFTSL